MTATSSAPGQLAAVRIIGLPLDTYKETAQHMDELRREFALIRSRGTPDSIPNKLLRIIEELTNRFGGFTGTPNQTRDEALARGDASVDLIYEVPHSVKDACIELRELLDEADEFCRKGAHLLTLESPPMAVEFRVWFLDEFIRQIDGGSPTSWDKYRSGKNKGSA